MVLGLISIQSLRAGTLFVGILQYLQYKF